jgi:CheY-like chemotaxis protein
VRLYLPRSAMGQNVQYPVPAREAETPVALASEDVAILVVEDDDHVRRMTNAALTELGYRVFEASGGEEALRVLERHPIINVLFTDVVMPGMDGRRLVEAAYRKRPDLKVFYTTGYTKNAIVHNGVLDPGVALLMKPFTVDQLARKVREVLDDKPA